MLNWLSRSSIKGERFMGNLVDMLFSSRKLEIQ